MKRIGCVGDNCVDHYRQTGEDHFGGNPVNVAVYTRRLGDGISYVGAVGTDGRGAALLDALRGRGVDVSHVHVDEGSTAVTYVEHINGDRVFGDYDEGVMAQFALTEEDIAFLGGHALVVSGLWGHAEGYLARIRQAGAVTAFDCSDRPEDPAAQTALPCTDIAFFSDDGSDDEALRQRLRQLAALGPRIVVATRGSRGSMAYDGQRFYGQGIVPCRVVDTMGAGSPAEINLKQQDIVNMGMAELVDAPVLLVGDIDRGGVFAQLYGTIALLEEQERKRIKGTVVNKFRGDRAILQPGIDILEKICGVPVAGVIPYTHVDIDDEDSLSTRFTRESSRKAIDIAVIKLPRISNFTDVSPLERFPNVSVRYIERPDDLKEPDLILIPGTKSTIADLLWLRQSGLEAAILHCHDRGAIVFGICGGFQMLGATVSDPDQVEAAGITQVKGMGLLPMDTVFRGDKVQRQTEGVLPTVAGPLHSLSGLGYKGYEIHMGRSETPIPPISVGENVYGSYIHGIFDEGGIAQAIVADLCRRKGLNPEEAETFDLDAYKQQQYDILADAVRSGMDMDFVYKVLNRQV